MVALTRPVRSKIAGVLALMLIAATTLVSYNRAQAAGANTQYRYSFALRGTQAGSSFYQCTDDSCIEGYIYAGENMLRSSDTQPSKGMTSCVNLFTTTTNGWTSVSGCSPVDTHFQSSVGGASLGSTTFSVSGYACTWEGSEESSCIQTGPRTITISARWSATGPLGQFASSNSNSSNRCKSSSDNQYQGRFATAVIAVDETTYNAGVGFVGKGSSEYVHQCQ